jgi:hypothetical protein
VGDGQSRLLVGERFQLPDCTFREALSLVELAPEGGAKSVKLLRGGADARDVMFVRLSFALDRFLWVEAEPNFIDISG